MLAADSGSLHEYIYPLDIFDLWRVFPGKGATDSNVVYPDHIAIIKDDPVASPNVLGVDIGDGNVSGNRYQCMKSFLVLLLKAGL